MNKYFLTFGRVVASLFGTMLILGGIASSFTGKEFSDSLPSLIIGLVFGGALLYWGLVMAPKKDRQEKESASNGNLNFVVVGGKSKTTAGLLAIFLGGLGAHKFYLGKTGWGIAYLLFCWTFIPAIFGLIEGIWFLLESENSFNKSFNKNRQVIGSAISPDTHVRCPDCREFVFKDANKCKHCGTSLIPQ